MTTFDRLEIILRMIASAVMMPATAFFSYQTYFEGKFVGTALFATLTVALVSFFVMSARELKHSY